MKVSSLIKKISLFIFSLLMVLGISCIVKVSANNVGGVLQVVA